MSSWQTLARKTAHELKNSLTPIRLTVEEMARAAAAAGSRLHGSGGADRRVSEIETLERRVRAFSELRASRPVNPEVLDLNALVDGTRGAAQARASRTTTIVSGSTRAAPRVHASADLVKGILTNLLENAAEAAGAGGSVLIVTTSIGTARWRSRCTIPGRHQRRRRVHAVRADDHLQEARHGTGPVDREEECAALRRRHHARDQGELGGAGFQSGAAGGAASLEAETHDTEARILIVDDEPNIGLSLRLILEGEGYGVTVCRFGGAASSAQRAPWPCRSLSAGRAASGRQRHRRACDR